MAEAPAVVGSHTEAAMSTAARVVGQRRRHQSAVLAAAPSTSGAWGCGGWWVMSISHQVRVALAVAAM